MERPARTLACCLLLALAAPAAAELPRSVEAFKERIAAEATDPKAAAKLWFDAVFVYLTVDKEIGAEMITLMCKDKDWKRSSRYLLKTLEEAPYVFRSYAVGARPENDYAMDPEKYELKVTRESDKPFADKEPGAYHKLFIVSSGASSPRPMTFQRNARGEYKAYEMGAIYTMVRAPASEKARKDDF